MLRLVSILFFLNVASCDLNRVGHFEYTYWSPQDGLQTVTKAVFMSDTRKTFDDARSFCESKDLALLALYSSDVNPSFDKYSAFKEFYNADFNCLEEYTYIDGTRYSAAEPWKHSKSRPIKYKLEFAPGEPNSPDFEFCLTLKRTNGNDVFGFNDMLCSVAKKFICEEKPDYEKMDVSGSGFTVTYNNAGHEVAGFRLLGQFEYTFDTKLWGLRTALTNIHLSNDKLIFDDALKSCASKNLKMFTFESTLNNRDFDKYSAFKALFSQMYKNFERYVYVGVRKAGPNTPFTLAGGEPLRYSLDYAAGEPNNLNNEHCLSVHSPEFGMNDHFCANGPVQYLCEEPLDFSWVDQPSFSSLLSVTYKPKITSCGLTLSGGIIMRRMAQNETEYDLDAELLEDLF